MNLTPQGLQSIEDLARRHYVSTDAVMTLLQAVINGGGTMAQFSHPELGGSGQWMQGGMTMVGDMFNHSLKAKVDNLCTELAGLAASQPLFVPPAPPQDSHADVRLFVGNRGGQWWPSDLGIPSSTGAQNDVRYAVFPSSRRLAIEVHGQLTVYDTLNHQIGGVGQQQGSDASLTFTSQFGQVRISELPIVSGLQTSTSPAPPPAMQTSAPESYPPQTGQDESDIFGKIERLAELRQKGILTEEEFSGKKAELLGRL